VAVVGVYVGVEDICLAQGRHKAHPAHTCTHQATAKQGTACVSNWSKVPKQLQLQLQLLARHSRATHKGARGSWCF
jgi:hypothetical protein